MAWVSYWFVLHPRVKKANFIVKTTKSRNVYLVISSNTSIEKSKNSAIIRNIPKPVVRIVLSIIHKKTRFVQRVDTCGPAGNMAKILIYRAVRNGSCSGFFRFRTQLFQKVGASMRRSGILIPLRDGRPGSRYFI